MAAPRAAAIGRSPPDGAAAISIRANGDPDSRARVSARDDQARRRHRKQRLRRRPTPAWGVRHRTISLRWVHPAQVSLMIIFIVQACGSGKQPRVPFMAGAATAVMAADRDRQSQRSVIGLDGTALSIG